MKRVLQFKATECGYGCYENNEMIFEIKKEDLKFDVKEFYFAVYAEDNEFENISIENTMADDKEATRVYNCIQAIIKQVGDKLAELTDEASNDAALEE